MFGVGIFELLVILIVAVIALGPDKLPQTIVDIVKFFRAVRKTMAEAKESFDKEIQLQEIKQEALKYKDTLTNEVNKLTKDLELDTLREIRADVQKPLEEARQTLQEQTDSIHSTLQSLNTEIHYESTNKSTQTHIESNAKGHAESADTLDSGDFTKSTESTSLDSAKAPSPREYTHIDSESSHTSSASSKQTESKDI